MSEDRPSETPTLDCVICYNEIDVNDRKGYMLAPCDHIFHRQCLEQWMEIKVSFTLGSPDGDDVLFLTGEALTILLCF